MADYISYMREMIGNKPMFMVGAGTIIKDKSGGILLIKRTDNNCWGLPGGSCELGETFEQAAVREAREETGLNIRNIKLFDVFSGEEMRFVYPNGDEVYNAVCIYETDDFDGDISKDNIESSDVRFFPVDAFPENMHSPDLIIFTKYFKDKESK